jgi:hypothetical protein
VHLQTLLETWNRHVKDGDLTLVKWRVASEFDPVFPQLGKVSQVASQRQMPLAQGTGAFVDRVTGTAVAQTPWANLSLPTAAYANIRSASSTTKVVIASDDAELYGAVVFGTTQGDFGRSDTVEELFIATREVFWKHTVACATGGHTSDAYEPALGILVPLDAKSRLRRERLALAFVVALETGFFTPEQLSAEWALAIKADPEFAAPGEAMLAKLFFKRPRPAQTQRTAALGEVGTPESLPLLLQLMKKPDPAPAESRAALRRLATRTFLPDPPPDMAAYSEWKKWSDEALRQVRKRP